MRLLTVVYGTLTVFLHVHRSPLDQNLVHCGKAAAYGLRLGHNGFFMTVLTSIQLTGSILSGPLPLFAPASYGLFEAKCGRIQLQRRDGTSRCELCRVKSPCVREFCCTTDMYFCKASS